MQPFPNPKDASDEILLRLAHRDIKVQKYEETDAQTPARVPSYKLTLWALGSDELKL